MRYGNGFFVHNILQKDESSLQINGVAFSAPVMMAEGEATSINADWIAKSQGEKLFWSAVDAFPFQQQLQ